MLTINAQRLWDALMELARIGATPKGGVRRLALSDEDRRGRDCFVGWCREAAMTVEVDAIGNIFARRAGPIPIFCRSRSAATSTRSPRAASSTAPTASWPAWKWSHARRRGRAHASAARSRRLDERRGLAIRSDDDGLGGLRRRHTLEHALQQRDIDGVSVRDALAAIGYAGATSPHRLGAYFEAHIEQGPVLEEQRRTIGVVLGALGQRWFDVVVLGQDAHAGPTPMQTRRDALLAASRWSARCIASAPSIPTTPEGPSASWSSSPTRATSYPARCA
jgi:N-carbamoyl-L-amino-acid hydrolase